MMIFMAGLPGGLLSIGTTAPFIVRRLREHPAGTAAFVTTEMFTSTGFES
jgi:hypothetical protein